jgi:hypothetical protein
MQGKRTPIELCAVCTVQFCVHKKPKKGLKIEIFFFPLKHYNSHSNFVTESRARLKKFAVFAELFPLCYSGLPVSFLRSLLMAIHFFARVFPLCGNPYPLYGSSYPFCESSCPFCGSPYPLREPLSSLSKFLPPLWEPLSSSWGP